MPPGRAGREPAATIAAMSLLPSDADSWFPADADPLARTQIARIEGLATVFDREHAGTRVRWRRFGPEAVATPPVVLLHGGHGSWMHWLRNIEAISAHHTLWLPDLPGYHQSATPPAPQPGEDALAPMLGALQGTLDGLVGHGTPIALGGFSFGGLVAARLAVQRGHIDRLALVGSGGHATLRRLTVEMRNWRAAPDRAAERAALRHNLMALMLHDEAALDALAFEIHDIACHGTRFRSKESSLAGGLQAALDVLDSRAVPQWLAWGEFDVTGDPRPLLSALTAGHPLRHGELIEGAGHWAQYERPERFNASLLRWFS
ncbi:4,5:9,10-diseco-3-hydroxy-5,9,17-trioxoandrosta-1 (10),2-diene-4-oate hydrolase [Xylophilus ampelinus]|nr:4,5:9,10-diseco-3-hydroxy-5,9,17-trioxoandrosta-1 (10),2-diene-4-oate hydrolase [Xylophilus ampelinus]